MVHAEQDDNEPTVTSQVDEMWLMTSKKHSKPWSLTQLIKALSPYANISGSIPVKAHTRIN